MKKIILVALLWGRVLPVLALGCKPGFIDGWARVGDISYNKCFSCDSVSTIELVEENDSDCPNREIVKKYGRTYSVLKECPKEHPLKTLQGCHKCDEERAFDLLKESDNDVCVKRSIAKTEGGFISVFSCPSDKPLRLKAEYKSEFDVQKEGCYPCDLLDARTLIDPENDQNVCPNRETLPHGRSILKQCPPEAPLKTIIYGCRTCNDKDDFPMRHKEDGDACPDRETWTFEYSIYSSLKCPPDKPMRGLAMAGGFSCYSCDSHEKNKEGIFSVAFDESECRKCPENRYYNSKTQYCDYKKSPVPGFPLKSISQETKYVKYARFYSCDEKSSIKTTSENCALCPNRKYENGACHFKCPDSFVLDWNEGCIFCNTKKELSSVWNDDCLKCPNRKMDDSKCVLKNDLWTKTKLFFSSLFDKEDLK